MSNVHDYAEERAARIDGAGGLDDDLADMAGSEMAEALARAAPLAEPAASDRPVTSLQAQWARFKPQFAEAMEGGPHNIDDLERRIFSGAVYLWPGRDAAVVAEPITYPSGETDLQTLWAVGDMAEVVSLVPGIEATARLLGCAGVLVEGRAGWERVLKPHGYQPWSRTVRKVL